MANIAVIGADIDISVDRLANALISKGHTCTKYREDSGVSLLSFDLIMTTRVDGGADKNQNIMSAYSAGIPVICGFDRNASSGTGLSASSLAGKLGIASSVVSGSNNTKKIISLTNDFVGLPVNSELLIHSNNDFVSYIPNSSIVASAKKYFGLETSPNTNTVVAVCKRGDLNLMNNNFSASCAYAGFLYAGYNAYTTEAINFIDDLVNKVIQLNASKKIKGRVVDTSGNALSSEVFLYNQSNGAFVQKTMSTEAGDYSFDVLDGVYYFIVCRSQLSTQNYQINAHLLGVDG